MTDCNAMTFNMQRHDKYTFFKVMMGCRLQHVHLDLDNQGLFVTTCIMFLLCCCDNKCVSVFNRYLRSYMNPIFVTYNMLHEGCNNGAFVILLTIAIIVKI